MTSISSDADPNGQFSYDKNSSRYGWLYETKTILNTERANKIRRVCSGTHLNATTDNDIYQKVKQEHLLLMHFERKLMELCQRMRVHETVEATAMIFFKRFYLVEHSVFEQKYSPIVVCATCLLLAGKTEEQRDLGAVRICEQVGLINHIKDVIKMELVVLKALKFQLRVYHPFAPARHLLRMFQTFIDPGDYDSFCGDVERILRLSYLTECPFLFTPGQIALASLELACTHESTQWAHKYESVFREKFLKNINFEDQRLRRVVEEVMSQLVATKETKPPSKAVVMNLCSSIGIYLPNV